MVSGNALLLKPNSIANSHGIKTFIRCLLHSGSSSTASGGCFFLLSSGLSNLGSSISLSSRTGFAQSLSFVPLLRSKFGVQMQNRTIHTVRMEANQTVVPSIVVYVTVPNKEAGIESVYEWKGEIQNDSEELLIIKTRESLLGALTEHVKANHEYEVPEVISLPITGGNLQYLEWIKKSTRD